MGFRSTLMGGNYWIAAPEWFVQKYPDLYFSQRGEKPCLSFAYLEERKFYAPFNEMELMIDIQKVLKELDISSMTLVLLHECDGITKITITPTSIIGMEPTQWKKVDQVEHDYCYQCSDPKTVLALDNSSV